MGLPAGSLLLPRPEPPEERPSVFYAGVLIGFPTHLFLSIVIVDFAYTLAWAWTLLEIVWCVTVGAVVGKIAGAPTPDTATA